MSHEINSTPPGPNELNCICEGCMDSSSSQWYDHLLEISWNHAHWSNTYMDYMDCDVRCPKKAIKLNRSHTHWSNTYKDIEQIYM